MSLDNFGGFSHGGRRLELMMDGRFLETSYTDVVGDRRNKSSGNYAIDQTKAALHLSHATGAVEVLFKVDYGGVEFWVKEEKRKLIQEPGEKWLRQTSLRRVK